MVIRGLEVGFNRLGNVDTMQRYIYSYEPYETDLDPTNDSEGCIRMGNRDVIELLILFQ